MLLRTDRFCALLLATVIAVPSMAIAADDEVGKKSSDHVFKVESKPAGKDAKPITIEVDVTEAPDAKEWSRKAADYALEWYPKLCDLLRSDCFEPARDVRLVFKPMDGVAHASGNTVTISSKWIEKNPDDFGMVAHELVHVVQQYRRRGAPGWLTEGIADYVRYYVVEPGSKRARFDRKTSNYRTGYQPTAGFLNWIEKRRPNTVTKLNTALREGKYTADLFKDLAGGDPDALWEEFKASDAG